MPHRLQPARHKDAEALTGEVGLRARFAIGLGMDGKPAHPMCRWGTVGLGRNERCIIIGIIGSSASHCIPHGHYN